MEDVNVGVGEGGRRNAVARLTHTVPCLRKRRRGGGSPCDAQLEVQVHTSYDDFSKADEHDGGVKPVLGTAGVLP